VITKITDDTYKINCGRKGKPQVIHVDRIKKKYPQNLPGEEPWFNIWKENKYLIAWLKNLPG
jgi:hypothetical protein